MNTATHTPTKWSFAEFDYSDSDRTIASKGMRIYIDGPTAAYVVGGETREIATKIVHCVNLHGFLVDALHAVKEESESGFACDDPYQAKKVLEEVMYIVRTALAKVTA